MRLMKAPATLAVLLLVACVETPVTNGVQSDLAPNVAHNEVVNGWQIYCERPATSLTGARTGRNACYLGRGFLFTHPIASATSGDLTLIAESGRVTVEPPGLRTYNVAACPGRPRRHGVDGTPLNGLSTNNQISLLLAGRIYAEEDQAAWPYCNIYINQTDLAGFPEAYTRFVEVATELNYI